MNDKPDKDWQLQSEAEQAAGVDGRVPIDPTVVLYQDIFAVLREPVAVDLPADFSKRVAGLAGRSGLRGEARFERWLAMGLRACLLAILLLSATPYLADLLESIVHPLADTGSALLIQAIGAITLVLLADAAFKRARNLRVAGTVRSK